MSLQPQYEPIARLASDISGASRETIRRIIQASNRQGYILHGNKYRHDIPDCVRPLAPEGHCSYWNSGSRIFGVLGDKKLVTDDSVVFNYAHCRNPGKDKRRVHVVIANYQDLKMAGVDAVADFKSDDYVTFRQNVPAALLHQIQIEVEFPTEAREREFSQACERALIEMVCDTFCQGYSPGTVEIHRVRGAHLQLAF